MADLSILDLSLARMRQAGIDPADAPALIAVERVWKKRKAVLAFLRRMLPPPDAEIECVVANLHLGDGRQLGPGERAKVPMAIAELVVGNRQAVHVG
jgi:hypothetical protein